MKQVYTCPNCGAEIKFASSLSVSATCAYCSSLVVRHDMDLELVGKQGMIMDDMSPFQVGTRGSYKGEEFTLIGRLKVLYDSGTWSEWFLLFDHGKEGWLAEAQGFYMINFEETIEAPPRESCELGKEIKIAKDTYVIDDMQEIKYAGSEGELPFNVEINYKGFSVDLRGPKGKFGNILYDYEGAAVYLGEYLDFEEFQFTNLREIDGW